MHVRQARGQTTNHVCIGSYAESATADKVEYSSLCAIARAVAWARVFSQPTRVSGLWDSGQIDQLR